MSQTKEIFGRTIEKRKEIKREPTINPEAPMKVSKVERFYIDGKKASKPLRFLLHSLFWALPSAE